MSEDLLDNGAITGHEANISIKNGASFTLRLKMLAVLIMAMGIAMILSGGAGLVIGPLLLFGAGFVLTSSHGVDISLRSNYVREYHERFFFFKSGKWLPLSAYSDICILKIGKKTSISDFTGVVSTELDASKNEVYLMTHDHRRRFLLKICKSHKEAKQFANQMAEKLGKRIKQFNPTISRQTQERLSVRR